LTGLEARVEWNLLRPPQGRKQPFGDGATAVMLEGGTLQLQVGDVLLFVGPKRRAAKTASSANDWEWRTVESVHADTQEKRTRVTWSEPLAGVGHVRIQVYVFR